VYDSPAASWRGGQLLSSGGGTSTVRLQAEAHIIRTVTCATSLIPVDAQAIGTPLACRVSLSDYSILEVVGSFSPDPGPRNDAADIAKGIFHVGAVPRSITGEPTIWWRE
jgi:hypothetical protein